ncbi:MAG: DUF302 domain-containing protein [Methylococcaceae bacterium]|nr:DUF302 domain-containing protein [Methylococcaceae bacterium]
MGLIRNILAIIGLIALIGGGYAYSKFGGEMAALNALDPGAKKVYGDMWTKLKETGTSADATVWKKQIEDGISAEDAAEAMGSVATELNIKAVGVLPLSKEVEAKTGKKQRLLTIYQYCNPMTAMTMVEYSDAFSAYLPCRIAMVEDKKGKLWLYALDMDMMIFGGKTLPDKLFKEATKVKQVILDIMEAGATGEF